MKCELVQAPQAGSFILYTNAARPTCFKSKAWGTAPSAETLLVPPYSASPVLGLPHLQWGPFWCVMIATSLWTKD